MKPSELLIFRLEDFLVPALEDKGFRFSKSQKTFKRKVEDLGQEIAILASVRNEEDYYTFQVGWMVNSTKYGKWYKETWGGNSQAILYIQEMPEILMAGQGT